MSTDNRFELSSDMKEALVAYLAQNLVLSVEMSSEYEGDSRYVSTRVSVSLDGVEIASESGSTSV